MGARSYTVAMCSGLGLLFLAGLVKDANWGLLGAVLWGSSCFLGTLCLAAAVSTTPVFCAIGWILYLRARMHMKIVAVLLGGIIGMIHYFVTWALTSLVFSHVFTGRESF